MWLFDYFNFERIYNVLKSKSLCILLNKKINFNNKEWEIPHTALERRTLSFSSYRNANLKVKLWRVGACKRKKRAYFAPFILSKWDFLRFVFYLAYGELNTISEYAYFYISKNITLYTFVESPQCILNKVLFVK